MRSSWTLKFLPRNSASLSLSCSRKFASKGPCCPSSSASASHWMFFLWLSKIKAWRDCLLDRGCRRCCRFDRIGIRFWWSIWRSSYPPSLRWLLGLARPLIWSDWSSGRLIGVLVAGRRVRFALGSESSLYKWLTRTPLNSSIRRRRRQTDSGRLWARRFWGSRSTGQGWWLLSWRFHQIFSVNISAAQPRLR